MFRAAAALSSLLIAGAVHAQTVAPPPNREAAQQMIFAALDDATFTVHASNPPATGWYKGKASQPCYTRYQVFIPPHTAEGSSQPARTYDFGVDWSEVVSVEPTAGTPARVTVKRRSATEWFTIGGDRRARFIAAANYLIRACEKPYNVAADPSVAPHHAAFKAGMERLIVPYPVDGRTVARYRVTPLGRCRMRIEAYSPAATINNRAYPELSLGTADIDWAKIPWLDYDSLNKAVVFGGNPPLTLPGPSDQMPYPAAISLQVACGVYSRTAAGLPATAKPWGQTRDTGYTGWLACRYAGLPRLLVEHRWGGGVTASWQADFEKAPGQLIYSHFSLRLQRLATGQVAYDLSGSLITPEDGDFRTAAVRIEATVDGQPVDMPVKIDQADYSQPGAPRFSTIYFDRRGIADAFPARLKTGSTLRLRALDAQGRELRRATYDIRDVRNIEPALASTNWRCVMN